MFFFSVIMPLYNNENYVIATLDSLNNQTYQNFELIIVDDCSTDSSVKVIKDYLTKKCHLAHRTRLYYTEVNSKSGGLPRNIGIGKAKGKYIIFIDSDDLFINTALDDIHRIALKFPEAQVIHIQKYFNGINEKCIKAKNCKIVSGEPIKTKPTYVTSDEASKSIELLYYSKATLDYIIKRDFLIDNKLLFPTNLIVGEDGCFVNACMFYSDKTLVVPDIVYYVYRYRATSLSHNYNNLINEFRKRFCKSLLNSIVFHHNLLINKAPELSKYNHLRWYQLITRNTIAETLFLLRQQYSSDQIVVAVNEMLKVALSSFSRDDLVEITVYFFDLLVLYF